MMAFVIFALDCAVLTSTVLSLSTHTADAPVLIIVRNCTR